MIHPPATNAINVVIAGTDPAPSPIHPLPQNERYKITFSQEHATTKSGCSQSKILSASRHPRVYPRDGRTFWGECPPFSLRGGRCGEDAEKASKSHEKTSEDPTTFTLASSEWVLFSPFIRGAIHILKEPTSLSLPRPNRDQKADGGSPPSLPLAVAAPVPELSAADATSAAKTDLHSLVFSLSNRATRRRRIIATAKGGTGTDGRSADSRSNATSEAVLRSMDGMAPRPLVVAPPSTIAPAARARKRRARARPPLLSGDRAFAFH